MKDDYLTLRLSRDLARALARLARERHLPKSQLVREAVSRYVAAPTVEPPTQVSAAQVAEAWAALPRLLPREAAALAVDIEAARQAVPPPAPPVWD